MIHFLIIQSKCMNRLTLLKLCAWWVWFYGEEWASHGERLAKDSESWTIVTTYLVLTIENSLDFSDSGHYHLPPNQRIQEEWPGRMIRLKSNKVWRWRWKGQKWDEDSHGDRMKLKQGAGNNKEVLDLLHGRRSWSIFLQHKDKAFFEKHNQVFCRQCIFHA